MVGLIPDYCLIVVGANFGLSRMTKEHLGIAVVLKIPFFIVLTKVDMVDKEVLKKTISDINKILKSSFVNKKPVIMDYMEKETKTEEIDIENENRKTAVNKGIHPNEANLIEKL